MAEEKIEEIPIEDAIQEFEGSMGEFQTSEDYHDARERDFAVGVATPPQLRTLLAQVGIPRIYIRSIVERLVIEGFRTAGEAQGDEDLWGWFKANNLTTASQMLHQDTLVYGRGYVTIAAPDEEDSDNPMTIPDVPRIRVESPKSLFAKIDPRTQEVLWAVRVIKDESGDTIGATMYYPDKTIVYTSQEGELVAEAPISHGLNVVPVVPFTYSDNASDLYGKSAITPEIRSVTDAMSRMMMNMQTTSEIMATPQRILFGSSVDEINGDNLTGLELYTASYIAIEDPNGKAVQLPAAELRNFTEGMTYLLKMAAAYTGLPPQYLSFSDDNPASAEAINSSLDRLVRTCESLSELFGDSWEKVMRIAKLVMGQQLTLDDFRMETVWRNPGTPTYQAKADGVTKAYANGQGVIPLEQARIDMGYTPEQRRQMEEWDKQSPLAQMDRLYSSQPGNPPPDKEVTDEPGADGGNPEG